MSISSHASRESAIGELFFLRDERADSRVEVAPGRGALVTSFQVQGRELFYLDEATLMDPSKNVRGGNPVLFPAPGKLEEGGYARGGQVFPMRQHGFARNLPWSAAPQEDGSLLLTLCSNEQTRAEYPYEFVFELRLTLRGACLTLDLHIHNRGQETFPFAVGFHPYFAVRDKGAVDVATDATRVFDNVARSVVPFHGFDFTRAELDYHLLDHGASESSLSLGDGARVQVRASPEFTHWVVWSVAGKDYVCLEPWSAPGNALNSGERLLELSPDAHYHGFVSYELVG
jgi:galactose mutarotase-like enzyme